MKAAARPETRGPDVRERQSGRVQEHPAPLASAEVYGARHERLEHYVAGYMLPTALIKRLGIDVYSGTSRVVLLGIYFIAVLAPLLSIAALTGTLSDWLPIRAVFVAGSLAFIYVATLIVVDAAIHRISAMHRALVDEREIDRLRAWDRRWYSAEVSALVGGLVGVVLVAGLYALTLNLTGITLPSTALFVCGAIGVFAGEYSYGTGMVAAEFRRFASSRFALYPLSPLDTDALQRASSGLRELLIMSIAIFPLFLVVLLTLLPAAGDLSLVVTGSFLLLGYLFTGVGIVLPLHYMGEIVKAEKRRVLAPVRARLAELLPRVPDLSSEDHEAFVRLQAVEASISSSKESFLGIGPTLRIAGAVALSTITVVAPVLLQAWFQSPM